MSNSVEILVGRAQSGDVRAFSTLVERYTGCVWAICISYLRDTSECEELVQDTFIRAYQELGSLRNAKAFGRWLSQIARTQCLNHLRSRKRHERMLDRVSEGGLRAEPSAESPHDTLVREEARQHILSIVDALPPKTREAMGLVYIEGCSTDEAAAFLGISGAALRKRISFGRGVLRERYEAELAGVMGERRSDEGLKKRVLAAIPFGTIPVPGIPLEQAGEGKPLRSLHEAATSSPPQTQTFPWSTIGWAVPIAIVVTIGAWWGTKPHQTSSRVDIPMAPVEVGASADNVESDADAVVVAAEPVPLEPARDESESPAVAQAATAVIAGRVRNADTGEPLSGLTIHASRIVPGKGYDRARIAMTGSDGAYRIEGLPEGTYDVRRGKKGGFPDPVRDDRLEVSLTEGEVFGGVDMRVPLGIPITGRVVDPSGRGVPAATITFFTDNDTWHRSGQSQEDGSFQLDAAKSGGILRMFAVSQEGMSRTTEPLLLPEGGIDGLVLTLEPRGGVSGVVINELGEPPSVVRIEARPADGDPFLSQRSVSGETNADGEFTLRGLGAGEYVVRASKGNGKARDGAGVPVVLGPGQWVNSLRLVYGSRHTIGGRVVDEAENPIPDATVSWVGPVDGHTRTEAEGAFSAEPLIEGAYRIAVSADGYARVPMFDVRSGTRDLQIEMYRAAYLSGRVIDSVSRQPITAFDVLVASDSVHKVSDEFTALRNQEGRFLLEGVEPGPCTLYVRAETYALEAIRLENLQPTDAPEDLIVPLTRSGEIEGYVSVGESPVPNVQIRIAPASTWLPSALSGPDGYYLLDQLSGGAITLHVTLPIREEPTKTYRTKLLEVEVVQGKVARADIRFAPGVATVTGSTTLGDTRRIASVALAIMTVTGEEEIVGWTDGLRFVIEDVPLGEAQLRLVLLSDDGQQVVHDQRVLIEQSGRIGVDPIPPLSESPRV